MKRLLSVIQSVLAAFFGVQSDDKRQQDFQADSPWPYIITGIFLTLMLVILLILLVRWLSN